MVTTHMAILWNLLIASWVLSIVLVCTVDARFVVEKESISVLSPLELRSKRDGAIGNFGVPVYGGSMVGIVVYPDKGSSGCNPFDGYKPFKSKFHLPVILLLDRGEFMATEINVQTSAGMVAVIVPTSLHVVTVLVNHGEKAEKFLGTDFKRWQQKMLFYLTTLNLTCFLYENAPTLKEDETDQQIIVVVDAWKHVDFLCRNYILNGLDNTLYNVYSPIKTAKELWESLEKKYKTEDAGSKKFVVWNGQRAAAAAVLVADNVNVPLITMDSPEESSDAEGYIEKIEIPSALIERAFGKSLKAAYKKGDEDVVIKLDWSESMPHPDERVEYELWTNSNDECGIRCDEQMNFIKDFKGHAQILEKGGFAQFTPHYITWYCPRPFILSNQCKSQCINHGRYCAPDPEQDFGTGCSMKQKRYSKECAEDVMKSLDLPIEKKKTSMGDPEADVENEVLNLEQELQVRWMRFSW
ncbi:hypothetical protein HYC85_018753 [Camellia sinensis]|uniref:Vacuolar sorting receptor thioredoxin-like domain-containing protein n=1 Tax=Camellia sinensis TaxID=4442 RepID=A0A7J7GYY3_CAMSI|nr:hypothetical protein HYC85_018753 [Camellia sinensis]